MTHAALNAFSRIWAQTRSSIRPGVLCLLVIVSAAGLGTFCGVRYRLGVLTDVAWEFSRPTPREGVVLPGVELERALEGLIEVRPFLQRTAEEIRQFAPRSPISESTPEQQVW